MANRQLAPAELSLTIDILREVRQRLEAAAGGDPELLFALRRKIAKELGYDERSKPMERRRIKAIKRQEQAGNCAVCQKPLPDRYCVLDRFAASAGYTVENTRLICESCDRAIQSERGYR